MEKDLVVSTGKDVTIVISRHVFPGRIKDYEEWIRKMVTAAGQAPGSLGVTTLIPQKGETGLYNVIFRFKDQESVDAWENSEIRRKLTGEAEQFSRYQRQTASGLETWFIVPDCPEAETPPVWKHAVVTFIGVFLASTVLIKTVQLLKLSLNFYIENLLISALVVASLTWVIMPLLTRVVFRRWLFKVTKRTLCQGEKPGNSPK